MPTPDFVLALREKIGTAPLWLSGVTAVVLRGTEILLVRRADNNEWTPVTGIIDPGEEPAVAARREVLEEAAVDAVAQRLTWVHVLAPTEYDNGDRTQYLDLVFRFRWIKSFHRLEIGHDRISKDAGRREVMVRLEGGVPLILVVIKDDRAVLRALVLALPIQSRRVVIRPEDLE